ncbi:hypothetical protein [Parabacteroides provencensis]|uniref:hypothetical protein n=1 Tax=Parabacteroides provencensis TaxID=1944636 RepID=UPI000C144ECB|nr:hypothetical protein [Parabacteroides provencensis]
MNTQEIINELTKYDRLAILEALQKTYSRRYIDYMFHNGRKRTALFKETVKAYWEGKQKLTQKVDGLIYKLNNKKEEELA